MEKKRNTVAKWSLLVAGVWLALAVASVRSLPAAWAQVRDPKGVAVVVGNRNYRNERVPEVSYAHRDATAFRHYVVEVLGYDPDNVIDLRDADQATLESVFGNERSHEGGLWRYLDPEGGSDVVVFYSGHGVPGLKDKRSYLLPVNADPDTAEINGYPLDVLYKNLSKLEEARSVRVFLDSCFSGDSDRGMLVRAASPVFVRAELPEAMKKLTVLTAASGQQLASWDEKAEHGLFTHHLMEALYGKADRDGDGKVTAAEAKRYLDRHMTRAARRTFGRHQKANLSGDETVVLSATLDGGFATRPVFKPGAVAPELAAQDSASPPADHAAAELESVQGKLDTALKEAATARSEGTAVTGVGAIARRGLPDPAPTRRPQPGEVFRDCRNCPELVVVEAGHFLMGSRDGEGARDERPAHSVRIVEPFAVGRYEVTVNEYRHFVNATRREGGACHARDTGDGTWRTRRDRSWENPGFEQTGTHPVVCVSWDDATEYVSWLSKETGKPYRLLTEAEWEYVARAGSRGKYQWGDDIGRNKANCNDCGSLWDDRGSAPVGSFQDNGFGLFDVHGNVWEWVADCWHESYERAPTDGKARVGAECGKRVLRGGSWYNSPAVLRSANRYKSPTGGSSSVGLRVARTLSPPTLRAPMATGGRESATDQFRNSEDATRLARMDDEAFGEAKRIGKVDSYAAYLDAWPSGRHRADASRLRAEAARVGKIFRDCEGCPEMVVVPAGRFKMGSPPEERGRGRDEGPLHLVTIDHAFAVGKYEVTLAEWNMCVRAGDCDDRWKTCVSAGNCAARRRAKPADYVSDSGVLGSSGRYPVNYINHDSALDYTRWLSKKTGAVYRLLSESEWEYVARAGTRTSYWWGDTVGRQNAVCRGCGASHLATGPVPVGSFKPNPFGLYDVHGNVAEWVEDTWNEDYVNAPGDGTAWLLPPRPAPGPGHYAVARGGSWYDHPRDLRAASRRSASSLDAYYDNLGFRVAKNIPPIITERPRSSEYGTLFSVTERSLGECEETCLIEAKDGQGSFRLKAKIMMASSMLVLQLDNEKFELDFIFVNEPEIYIQGNIPFYSIRYSVDNDPGQVMYAVLYGRGNRESFFHYFIRHRGIFRYLGAFPTLSYDGETDLFVSRFMGETFYRLKNGTLQEMLYTP